MHQLRQYVDRIEGLAAFATEAAANPATQGVVLDVNPIWLAAYRLARTGLRADAFVLHWSLWPVFLREELARSQGVEGDTIDFGWTDKAGRVENFIRNLMEDYHKPIPTSSFPFMVKVIAKPAGTELADARARLVTLTASQNFFALVETRPLGRLAASSGDPCLANGVPGTIGGFLRDLNTVDIYAATCGHVASKGTSVTVSGTHIGTCRHSHAPNQLAPGQSCSPACTGANRLDLALIDVGNATVANTVTGKAAQIVSRQSIVMRGGVSGVNTFEVGGVVITYCPGNSNVCFENLFEVRPPSSGGILNPRLRTVLATVPTQGDSGAWVETSSSQEWCGILVAADSLMGYALEADDVITEAGIAFGTQLQVV
ncbi:hypothetical protein [Edaphobacter bradus]|uniref:hypothetical protein n=1 Tax=Edaphobacter bradus TaxID=2259016 RepID=UPI0021DF5C98|nr:hypothetical protein [Edaphobacter bradus]